MNAPRNRFLALSLVAVVTAATLVGCGDDRGEVADDPTPSAEPSSPSASEEPTEATSAPSPTETSAPAETVTVPVYLVGETPMGQRLFREFGKVEADDRLTAAAAQLASGEPLDPDYSSLFSGGTFSSVEHDDEAGQFVVALADDRWTTAPEGMTPAQARLAAQQLVYTLQGVQQVRSPVVVQLDGRPTTLFGLDTSAGIRAAAPLDVLSLVNVTSPEEGATVGDTFTASGVASSFEATVPWQVRQGEKVVAEGFSTAEGWMDKLYPWEAQVDVSKLAPGDYTFVAMTDDPSGGEGPGAFEDSKTITVE